VKRQIGFALLTIAAVALIGAGRPTQSTPESCVKAFAAAIQSGNLKAAAQLVKGGKPDFDYSQMSKQIQDSALKLEVQGFTSVIQGSTATATFKVSFTQGGGKPQVVGPETAHLELTSGSWLIVPAQNPNGRAPFSEMAMMLADPEMALRRAHGSAEATVCLSNMKQLCLACMMLANDYDDVLKLKPDAWKNALMPYVKNERLFYCPEDKSGAVSYSVNPQLCGKSLTSLANPAATVMMYEGHKLKLDFRHTGRACVGFADGHVKLINAGQAKTLRWKP